MAVNWEVAPAWARALRDTGTLEKWLKPKGKLKVSPSGEMTGALSGDFLDPSTWVRVDDAAWKEFCRQTPKQIRMF